MSYIQFDKRVGWLRTTNAQARLERGHLHLGKTGKDGAKHLAGHIQFDKRVGWLRATNFQARLERGHLNLGKTSKDGAKHLAG